MHKYLNFFITSLTISALPLAVKAAEVELPLRDFDNSGFTQSNMRPLKRPNDDKDRSGKNGYTDAKPIVEGGVEQPGKLPIQMPLYPSKILKLSQLLTKDHLEQLKSFDGGTIILFCCYGDGDPSPTFLNNKLKVSPATINPRITKLSMQRCGLTNQHLEGIDQFPNLRELYLLTNPIDDQAAPKMMKLTQLEVLDMSVTKITDVTVKALSQMTSLRALDLSFNQHVTDMGLSYFCDNTTLDTLIIKGTGISIETYELFEKKLKERGSTLKVDYFPRSQ